MNALSIKIDRLKDTVQEVNSECVELTSDLADMMEIQSGRIHKVEAKVNKNTEDIASLKAKNTPQKSIDFRAHIAECENRHERKKNVMIFNLPESDESMKEGKYKHDSDLVIELINDKNLGNPSPHILKYKVIRIGKFVSLSVPRPVKIIFRSSSDTQTILQGLWALPSRRNACQLSLQTKCTPDKTKI